MDAKDRQMLESGYASLFLAVMLSSLKKQFRVVCWIANGLPESVFVPLTGAVTGGAAEFIENAFPRCISGPELVMFSRLGPVTGRAAESIEPFSELYLGARTW